MDRLANCRIAVALLALALCPLQNGVAKDIASNPSEEAVLDEEIKDACEQGQLPQFIELMSNRIESKPTAFAYCGRAIAEAKLGKSDDAITDLTKALEIDPDCEQALAARAIVWEDRRELNLAMADANQLVQLDPKNGRYFALRSLIFGSMQNLQSALRDADMAVSLEPNSADLIAMRGLIHEAHGRYATAKADYELALRLDPESDNAIRALSQFLVLCRDEEHRDEARALDIALQRCHRTEWKNWRAIMLLAGLHSEVGNFDRAIELQQETVRLAPNGCRDEALERLDLLVAHMPAYSTASAHGDDSRK